MTAAEIDLMDVHHPRTLNQAYQDPDGVDWRLAPHDDQAVLGALREDAAGPAHADHR